MLARRVGAAAFPSQSGSPGNRHGRRAGRPWRTCTDLPKHDALDCATQALHADAGLEPVPDVAPPLHVAAGQMRGPGGVLSIELDSAEAAHALPGHLRLFEDTTSLGGVESLIEWRRRHDPRAPEGLLRLPIGLEAPADLIADLERGLRG